jgi:hypothetical protein
MLCHSKRSHSKCSHSKYSHGKYSHSKYSHSGGRREATAVHAGQGLTADIWQYGSGLGAERTLNMAPMFVTLEVFQLSG